MNRVFHTERMAREDAELLSAVLHESCEQVSTLRMVFRGYAAGGLEYRDEVTLMHRGTVLFHGKVTQLEPTGQGKDTRTTVTVSNLLWQMDRLTIGEQLADLKAAEEAPARMDWKVSAEAAMGSWQVLQGSCMSTAPGWGTRGTGIRMEAGAGLPSIGRTLRRIGAVSQWTALRALQQANPGSVFRVDYEEAVVRIADAFEGEPLVWNTEEVPIASAALSPQYAGVLSGVAVAVSYEGGTRVVKHPADIDPGEDGVRLFTASAANGDQAAAQAAYIAQQLVFYFNRASRLQNRGSIRLAAADLAESPISRRVLLVGAGTHDQWGEADNIVAAVDWDLLRGTAELSIGLTIGAPDFDTLTFPMGGGSGGSGGGGGGGGGEGDTTGETTTRSTEEETVSTTNRQPEKLLVELDDEVINQTADSFTWRLKWVPNMEVSAAALYVDGSNDLLDGLPLTDTFDVPLPAGLHTATVAVYTEDGEQASAMATVYTVPGDVPPDPPDPPAPGDTSTTGTDEVLHVWATQEDAVRGTGDYAVKLKAHTNRTGVFNYAWLINGQQLSGETITAQGLNYDQSYAYTLTVTDTVTQEKKVWKGKVYESAITEEMAVQVTSTFLNTEYATDIYILTAAPEGCTYEIFVAGETEGALVKVYERSFRVEHLHYGETYVWNAFIKDARGNIVAKDQGFLYYAAPPTPTSGTPPTPTTGTPPTPTTGTPPTPTTGTPPTPTTGTPPTPTTGTPPTPTTGTPPTPTTGGCPCAEKWTQLEGWKSDVTARLTALEQQQVNILARLTALENRTGGDCDCAAELAGLISAAVNAALADVRVAVQVGGVLEHNEIGNLQFTTNGHY